MTCKNFTITADTSDSPIVSEGIVSERDWGSIPTLLYTTKLNLNTPKTLTLQTWAQTSQDTAIIRSCSDLQSCDTHCKHRSSSTSKPSIIVTSNVQQA